MASRVKDTKCYPSGLMILSQFELAISPSLEYTRATSVPEPLSINSWEKSGKA